MRTWVRHKNWRYYSDGAVIILLFLGMVTVFVLGILYVAL